MLLPYETMVTGVNPLQIIPLGIHDSIIVKEIHQYFTRNLPEVYPWKNPSNIPMQPCYPLVNQLTF